MKNFAKYYAKGDKRRKAFSSSRRSSSASLVNSLFKVGASMAKAYEREAKRSQRAQARQVASYNRFLDRQERELARQAKQHEMALRRAERERAKAERERERAAKLQAKMEEQKRKEDEIADIEEENYLWTNVHKCTEQIVSIDDVTELLNRYDYEQKNDVTDGFFEKGYPLEHVARQTAEHQADKQFDLTGVQNALEMNRKRDASLTFTIKEPTKEDVREELLSEAKEQISAFFPWKQSKLRNAYVEDHLTQRFDEQYTEWSQKRSDYLAKKREYADNIEKLKNRLKELKDERQKFVAKRTAELFDKDIKAWEKERDEFYESLRENTKEVIAGDRDFVISAIDSVVQDEDLPMEYFVDFAYDENYHRVLVDLDLPEIEDIPNRKIVLTSTGKKSIRMKGQTDLRTDYANCVLGLSIYIAHLIFNVSLKIEEVEMTGFTQRKEQNSAVATDQYVFLTKFTRDTFSKIDFDRLSPIQIMDFFPHYFNMTKGYDMKQINLGVAYAKMESFVVADYDSFISSLPEVNDEEKPEIENTFSSHTSTKYFSNTKQNSYVNDSPRETFDKSTLFLSKIYDYIDRLSKDAGVNKHAENMNGVRITMTSGNFTGDGNTNTYRGKLFFCSIADLYRCLEQMHIDMNSFSSSVYALMRYALKVFMHEDIKHYNMLPLYEQVYHSLITMLKPMEKTFPKYDHVFLLAEVLCDYEKDMSWYNQYLSLIGQYIDIVKGSVQSSAIQRKNIDDFVCQLNRKGINVSLTTPTSSFDVGIDNDVDMQHLDPLFEDAARLIVLNQSGSTSLIQRKFAIGYNRAGRLMDQLEHAGIVGAAFGSKPREVLISDENTLNNLLVNLK